MYELNEKLRGLTPYAPVDGEGCIRLDANESFLALPEEFLKGIGDGLEMNRYPDPAARGLCEAFARFYRVRPESVVAGNGSDELISVIFSAFLMRGEAFATLEPDFSMYAQGGALAECRHVAIEKPNFRIDVEEVVKICRREGVRLLVFSNPCNPTSIVLDPEPVRWLIRELSDANCLVVLDEAYMDFSDRSLLREAEDYDNLIILRTCSKAMGMAAVRLGFAVAGERLSNALRAAKSPYNVNVLSQALGKAVLDRPLMLLQAREEILRSRDALMQGLTRLSAKFPGELDILPSDTNFISIVTRAGRLIQQRLLQMGVAVRFTGGLLRITCGAEDENKALLEALENILGSMV